MNYDLSIKVKNMKGESIKDTDANKELTVKDYCMRSLLYLDPEEKLDGVEKYARYKLANRLEANQNNVIGLNAEEVTKIKKLVGKFFGILEMGQVYDVLEGETKENNETPIEGEKSKDQN